MEKSKDNNLDVETLKLEKGYNDFGNASVQGLQNITYLLKFVIFKSKMYTSKLDIFSNMVTYVRFKLHDFSNFQTKYIQGLY